MWSSGSALSPSGCPCLRAPLRERHRHSAAPAPGTGPCSPAHTQTHLPNSALLSHVPACRPPASLHPLPGLPPDPVSLSTLISRCPPDKLSSPVPSALGPQQAPLPSFAITNIVLPIPGHSPANGTCSPSASYMSLSPPQSLLSSGLGLSDKDSHHSLCLQHPMADVANRKPNVPHRATEPRASPCLLLGNTGLPPSRNHGEEHRFSQEELLTPSPFHLCPTYNSKPLRFGCAARRWSNPRTLGFLVASALTPGHGQCNSQGRLCMGGLEKLHTRARVCFSF